MDLVDQSDLRFYEIVQIYKSVLIKLHGPHISARDVAKFIGFMCRAHINLVEYLKNLPNNDDSTYFTKLLKLNLIQRMKPDFETAVKDLLNVNADLTPLLKADSFVNAVREISPNLNWNDVCCNLDHPKFIIKDRIGLNLLLTIIRLGSPSAIRSHSLLVDSIYHHWQNVDGQYSLVSSMLKNPDLFLFADYIYSPVQMVDTFSAMNNKKIAAWKSVNLIDILLYLADNGYIQQVLEIFKFPVENCPDVLFMALLQIRPPLTNCRQRLFSILIPIMIGNLPYSGVILRHAWNSSEFMETLRPIIMHEISDWYVRGENDESRLSRILDVNQDLRTLSNLLNDRSSMFIIDLACLASRPDYLKFEKWLSDKIRDHGESFVQAVVKFLQRLCPQITGVKIPDDQIPKGSFQLPHESVKTMLTCLQVCIGNVSQELSDTIVQMIHNSKIIAHKQPSSRVLRTYYALEPTLLNRNLNAEQMYGPAIDSMPTLNTNTAGLSLGGTLNFGNVLCRKLPPSGVDSIRMLSKDMEKLSLCGNHTSSSAHLMPPSQPLTQTQPDNQICLSNSAAGNIITTSTQPTKPVINTQPIHPSRVKSIATATSIDTLLIATAARHEKITTPPDAIQNKIAFIFNNLCKLNLQQKCDEIKEIMTKEYWPWMIQYLVIKRASTELNFHSLYSDFLDALEDPVIIRSVTQETVRNIKVLLRSDRDIANFSGRFLLKNLGHWLGLMTLARNIPIFKMYIDLKSLIENARHKGQQELHYVIPFVAKVLESCAESKEYKPPNPWTMSIMNKLCELHQEQDLELNLKFEIEVLCKTLSIDITERKPIIYLRDTEIAKKIEKN